MRAASLACCLAHSGPLWLSLGLSGSLALPGSLSSSLWTSLALSGSLSLALSGFLLLSLALSGFLLLSEFAYKVLIWLTKPLLSVQQRCCTAWLSAGLKSPDWLLGEFSFWTVEAVISMVMDLVQYRKKRCLNNFEVSLVLDSESHMDDRLMDIDRLEWCRGRAGSWLWKTRRN